MQLNERATITLIIEGDQARNELGLLETEAKSLERALKEAPKGSAEWAELYRELGRNQDAQKGLRDAVGLTGLNMKQLQAEVKLLSKELSTLTPGTTEFITKSTQLRDVKTRLEEVKTQANGVGDAMNNKLANPSLWSKITTGVKTVTTAFNAFVLLGIVTFLVDMGKAIFETTAKFEKYEKVLETALGSQKLAKESMAAIKDMAANTAFSVDELTEGYVKMVNRGMKPSKQEMIALTDLAASQGKTFDQLVEAALDAQSGEMERLKEFGITAKKSGDQVTLSFKGMNQTVQNTPEAIQGAITKFGEMNGVAGQNAKMMETLNGKTSNLGDSFDNLMVGLGTGLRPVFIGILDLFAKSIPILTLLGQAIGSVILVAKGLIAGIIETVTNAGMMIISLGKAAVLAAQGDWDGAKKMMDDTQTYATKTRTAFKDNVKQSMTEIVGIWTDPSIAVKANFAGKTQGDAHGKGLTDAQKKALAEQADDAEKARKKQEADHQKHLEEVKKANAKALEEIGKLEEDAHINSIKDEEKREITKLMVKRDREVEAIQKGIQSEEIKNRQISLLNTQLETDITKVHADQSEKRKKAEEEAAQKRLEIIRNVAKLEQDAEMALLDWKELEAKGNATKLTEIARERATITLRITKQRLDDEEAAERAKAAKDITDTELLERTLEAIGKKYDNERVLAEAKKANEIAKIEHDLKEKKKEFWGNASSAFTSLLKGDLNAFVEHSAKLMTGEKKAWQEKLEGNMAVFEAVGQAAQAAAQFLADLAKKRADKAIAEAKREAEERIKILNAQVATEQKEIDKLEAEKQRIINESSNNVEQIRSSSEKTIADLEQQYRTLSTKEEKAKLDEQINSFKNSAETKRQEANDTADELIFLATDEANKAIAQIQKREKEQLRAAENEKAERIDKAEATRDAEIAAINKRADIDSKTRQKLLDEATAKFVKEKQMAESEATFKIEQATGEAKAKIDLATTENKTKTDLANLTRDAQLKAIEAMQRGDEKAAREILANAKKDAQEKIQIAATEADKKIDLAEKEKREKLKKLEAEKQTRIQSQQDLNRSIDQENTKARNKEIEAKRSAWKAQQKADIASAIISGALATIKALASGFFPVNLVFAAVTAAMTAVQVIKIKNQPEPQFATGGVGRTRPANGEGGIDWNNVPAAFRRTFGNGGYVKNAGVLQGGRHGSIYGKGGIRMTDNQTGQDVGEAEGGEPFMILSRSTYANNKDVIDRLLHSSLYRGGKKIAYRDGGVGGRGGDRKLYLDGRRIFREGGVEDADAVSEGGGSSVGGGSSSGNGSGGGVENEAAARQAHEEAKKQGMQQLQLLEEIRDAVKAADENSQTSMASLDKSLSASVDRMATQVGQLKGSINEVRSSVDAGTSATHQVKDAVYGTNQAGRLDAIIGAISSMK